MRTAIRDANWLGRDRALAWARLLAIGSVLAVVGLFVVTRFGTAPDPLGRPLGTDFSSFWTAARLALAGIPVAAWHPAAHGALQHASFPPSAGFKNAYYAFFYPPPFLLLCLPFGALPYGAALALWLVLTGAAYFAAVRRLLPRSWPALTVLIAFPALLINAGQG
ncbi:MAG: glycosyltransferase 87 family protein, partial [Acetobacteraceae bacterium]